MATETETALLDIPSELRLRIYDFVLQPLLEVPEHYDTYVLPDEWPQTSLASYRALILSCKTSIELWPYLERHLSTRHSLLRRPGQRSGTRSESYEVKTW